VLNDLVSSGLVHKAGSGDGAQLSLARERDLATAVDEKRRESLVPIVWAMVCRSGGTSRATLGEQLKVEASALDDALEKLIAEGRVTRAGAGETASYSAATLLVPVDAEHGWEAAVFDHFQAVVRAIGTKVRRGLARSTGTDVNGGATLTFAVHEEHPDKEEVLGLLRRVRADVNELWNRVHRYNQQHPIAEGAATEVSFYFGQCVTSEDER
jgi:hypothetical protein